MESNINEKVEMEKQSLKGITIKKDVSDIRRAFEGSVHDDDYEYQEYSRSTVYSNSYDGDDEVFLETEETSESSVRITKPRHRRISDVIDSIGDSSPVNDFHFKFPDFTEGTSDYTSNHHLFSSKFQSPPVTPGSDVGYYSTGLSTPPSILNYKMMWSRTESPVDARADEHDGTKWGVSSVSDAKTLNAQEINRNLTKGNVIAKMPVAKSSPEYNMEHSQRGEAVILNNETFKSTSMQSRTGSNFDVDKLSATLKLLGFNVTIHNDLGYQDIRGVIDDLLERDYTHCDCLFVAVLTHGKVENYLHSKDHLYPLDMIWKPFSSDNCPTLAGKPKIFLIQACKGEGLDSGTRLLNCTSTETDGYGSPNSYTIPTMADFLIAFSTVEGFFSWRNPEYGTWFIRSLCDVLEENFKTMDLLKMMTIVSRRVALEFESFNEQNPTLHGLKQVPSIYSTLIRDVYFRPKAIP